MATKPKEISFKNVDMRKSTQMWDDDMSVSIFNFQPGLTSVGGVKKKSNAKVLHVGTRRTTSHAIGTRNFI